MKIDHAAEAQRIVEWEQNSAEAVRIGWETADAQHAARLAAAQVHATLALVEQLRIANLITLARGTVSLSEEMSFLSDEAANGLMKREAVPATPFSGPDEHFAFRDDIREGLGL